MWDTNSHLGGVLGSLSPWHVGLESPAVAVAAGSACWEEQPAAGALSTNTARLG